MKQLEVKIMGQSYLLGCPDGGDARLLEAVDKVDIAMCKIRDAGKIKARDRIAVLAALNLAFEVSDRPGVPAPVLRPEGAANDAADGAQLGSLLSRLDTALGVDGRLL
ncbi:MAG: cell division protein ZapA [Polaromonas sp.]|nr:cell division protein ZapA [Polaromonas sp.]